MAVKLQNGKSCINPYYKKTFSIQGCVIIQKQFAKHLEKIWSPNGNTNVFETEFFYSTCSKEKLEKVLYWFFFIKK